MTRNDGIENQNLHLNRSQFLIFATAFQAGLAILAFGLGWLLQINPFDRVELSGRALATGIAATIPMLILFAITYRYPVGPLKEIKLLLMDTLGPSLSECSWFELAWVALGAGISEELLFRAVLQTWLDQWGPVCGLGVSNLLFGFAHAVTPLYIVLAGLLGVYLGALFRFIGDGNLVVPVVAHALYDLVAFAVVRRSFRVHQSAKRAHQAHPSTVVLHEVNSDSSTTAT